jgi:hypothetical protein
MGGVGGRICGGLVAEICGRIFFGVVGMGEFVVFAGGFEEKWWLDVVF